MATKNEKDILKNNDPEKEQAGIIDDGNYGSNKTKEEKPKGGTAKKSSSKIPMMSFKYKDGDGKDLRLDKRGMDYLATDFMVTAMGFSSITGAGEEDTEGIVPEFTKVNPMTTQENAEKIMMAKLIFGMSSMIQRMNLMQDHIYRLEQHFGMDIDDESHCECGCCSSEEKTGEELDNDNFCCSSGLGELHVAPEHISDDDGKVIIHGNMYGDIVYGDKHNASSSTDDDENDDIDDLMPPTEPYEDPNFEDFMNGEYPRTNEEMRDLSKIMMPGLAKAVGQMMGRMEAAHYKDAILADDLKPETIKNLPAYFGCTMKDYLLYTNALYVIQGLLPSYYEKAEMDEDEWNDLIVSILSYANHYFFKSTGKPLFSDADYIDDEEDDD